MTESCYLLGLLCVMVPLGHVIWLLVAAFFRALQTDAGRPSRDGARHERRCVRCGTSFDDAICPECRLDPRGSAAKELRDLEAAARTVQGLLENGGLEQAACEQVYLRIEARQRLLLHAGQTGARPLTETAPRLLLRLEQWLGGDTPTRELSAEQNREILRAYRLLTEKDLQSLSPTALLGLARLLATVGLATRGLNVYRLVMNDPGALDATAAAIEAGWLAFTHEQWEQAGWFLNRALARPGAGAANREALALRDQLRARQHPDAAKTPAETDLVPMFLLEPEAPTGATEHAPTTPKMPAVAAIVTTTPAVEIAAPVPALPRRSLGEWLAVFMEERNVLWGEVVGGMLIVGCSIALVISLWQTLEYIPFFPFLIFAALTGALLGAGFYTLHHWKLQSTSRGLLLIGMLLVPLNFLVLAGLSRDLQAGWLEIATAGAGLLFFGWLTRSAGRILVRNPLEDAGAHVELLFVLPVVASALTVLFAPHLLGDDASPWLTVLGLVPALAQALAIAAVLIRMAPRLGWPSGVVRGFFVLIGISTFASVTALGFLIYSCQDAGAVLGDLSLPVAVLGVPLLMGGALVHRRAVGAAETTAKAPALERTAGTVIALVGMAVLFAAFAAALSTPWQRWLVGGINIAALAATAWGLRLPLLHVPAQIYLILLCHLGFRDQVDFMALPVDLPVNMAALMILQVLAAEVCAARRRLQDAQPYAIGAGVSTVLAGFWALVQHETHPGMAAGVLGIACTTWLIANRRWRWEFVNYLALALLFGSTWFLVGVALPNLTKAQVGVWSLLGHASFCVLLGIVLDLASARLAAAWLDRVYCTPARMTAIAGSSLAALLLLPPVMAEGFSGCSIAIAWLAILWLVLAFSMTSVMLFSAFQLALAAAVACGALAWAQHAEWQPLEPRSLQLVGLGLAVVGLCWESARRWRHASWAQLLPARAPAVDRLVLSGLVVGQSLLAVAGALPAVGAELNLSFAAEMPLAWQSQAAQPAPWMLLALLAATLLIAVKRGNLDWPAHGLTILLLTVPLLLAAGWPAEDLAAASALRWGLALSFAVGSALLWLRGPLERRFAEPLPVVSLRTLLLGGAVVPVLFITCVVAGMRLAGEAVPGPLPASVFARLGGNLSLLLPLALISATWAGNGCRDRLPVHLLAGGLLGVLSLMAGRLLQAHHGAEHWVQAAQLGAAFAWMWALGWLVVARRLGPVHRASVLVHSPLLTVQAHVGSALLAIVLVWAGFYIAFIPFDVMPPAMLTVGSIAGWLVFGLTAAGLTLLALGRGQHVTIRTIGTLSIGVPILLASAAERWGLAGLPTLMLALAAVSLLWACAEPLLASPTLVRWVDYIEWTFADSATFPALVAGAAAVLLAVQNAIRGELLGESAAGLALIALACALLAWHQRHEAWAFRGGPMLASALSLVVWQWHFDEPFGGWAHLLLQVDLATLGAVSLLWLLARRRFCDGAITLGNSPCLAVQTALALAGNLPLLVWALFSLISSPRSPVFALDVATPVGWLALLLNLAALAWYVGLVAPRQVVHVAGIGGLLFGILTAAGIEAVWPAAWLAHHVLTGCWTVLGLVLLTLSWPSHRYERLGPQLWSPERRAATARLLRTWLPERVARGWVSACAVLVVSLVVLAAWPEPTLPAWASGNVLAIGLLLGTLAVWSRQAVYSYGSGLTFNVVGLLLHQAWARAQTEAAGPLLANSVLVGTFLSSQAICFALAGFVWSMLEVRLRRRTPSVSLEGLPSFAHAALAAGLHVLALLIALAISLQFAGLTTPISEPLAWCALIALATAALANLVEGNDAESVRCTLHACGLLAIGLIVQAFPLTADTGWYAAILVATYVAASTALVRAHTHLPVLRRWLPSHGSPDWFFPNQALLAAALTVLSLWMSVQMPTLMGRLSGPAVCILAAVTWWLLVGVWSRVVPLSPSLREPALARGVTLVLLFLAGIEAACACIDPDAATWWLECSAAVVPVFAGLAAIYHLIAHRLATAHAWRAPLRRLGSCIMVTGYAAAFLLAALLWTWFEPLPGRGAAPLPILLVIVAAFASLTLAGLSLHFALGHQDDPLGVPIARRGLYVYAAEAMIAALVLHLRLTVPQIIPNVLGQYWPLSVMVVAFAGVGLGEFMQRRRPVLAAPLRRTALALAMVPLLAYLLQPLAARGEELGRRFTFLRPLLHYLDPSRLRGGVAMQALCWLLLGLLHAWVARLRGSANQGLLAALFINFAVWALLGSREDLAFLTHPQLWLIPIGLILLAAEFINRAQLGPWPSAVLRSLSLLCIYLSSTFDMLLTGLGNSVVLPVVLAVLSVLGALLGILFRMRAPLLFGSAFLGVVIFAQIWHAAVDRQQAWVWWACGIVLGLTILALFAYFEKHRNKVLKMFENIRHWN